MCYLVVARIDLVGSASYVGCFVGCAGYVWMSWCGEHLVSVLAAGCEAWGQVESWWVSVEQGKGGDGAGD